MSDAPTHYLSRARLRRDVPAAALRALLVADDPAARVAATHRLVWMLFADDPDRRRDFLWREAEPGLFYLLSARPPVDRHDMFHLDPPKPFAPALATGDRLAFALRVNATVARGAAGAAPAAGGRARGKRSDVVMDALRDVPPEERAAMRRAVLDRVAPAWLARQGEACGFALDAPVGEPQRAPDDMEVGGAASAACRVRGYRVLRVDRGRRAERLQIGVMDVEGVLRVRDPERFIAALTQGFGRAKAFGCGLMLVRRAP